MLIDLPLVQILAINRMTAPSAGATGNLELFGVSAAKAAAAVAAEYTSASIRFSCYAKARILSTLREIFIN